MAFFRKKKTQEEQLVLLFDIGSASVAGALVLVRAGKKPQVLYNKRHKMVFQPDLNFDRFLESMLSTLALCVEDIHKHGLSHVSIAKTGRKVINKIMCTYASPWYLSSTQMVSVMQEKPFAVTKDLLEDMVTRELEQRMKEGHMTYMGDVGREVDIIEQTITGIKLNGYIVNNPYGRETQRVDAALSLTTMARGLRLQVEDRIGAIFGTEEIVHHSFGLVAFRGIQNLFEDVNECLILDISGEVTDVSLVRDGALFKTVSFPYGAQHMVRGIREKLGLSSQEVRTMLELYEQGGITKKVHEHFEEALAEIQHAWSEEFEKGVRLIEEDFTLPQKVFVTAAHDILPRYVAFLKTMPSNKQFEVLGVAGAALGGKILFRLKKKTDMFIAFEALYAHLEFETK